MVTIALVVITDGRADYLAETITYSNQYLKGNITQKIMVNDSGDSLYTSYLNSTYPEFLHIDHDQRKGLASAIQSGWTKALEFDIDYVFHLEEDFTLTGPCDLELLSSFLEDHKEYAEVVLRRQPWSPEEHAGAAYFGDTDPMYVNIEDEKYRWFTLAGFSLNPCLVPRNILELGWEGDETVFKNKCLEHGYSFVAWGHKSDPPAVLHIGVTRSQGWSI